MGRTLSRILDQAHYSLTTADNHAARIVPRHTTPSLSLSALDQLAVLQDVSLRSQSEGKIIGEKRRSNIDILCAILAVAIFS